MNYLLLGSGVNYVHFHQIGPQKGLFCLGSLQHWIDFSQVSRAQPQPSSGFNL
jgi:hypothetical protein